MSTHHQPAVCRQGSGRMSAPTLPVLPGMGDAIRAL